MEQAIKFAFGMLRAERANAKERKGNNSDMMVREAVVAPMAAENRLYLFLCSGWSVVDVQCVALVAYRDDHLLRRAFIHPHALILLVDAVWCVAPI